MSGRRFLNAFCVALASVDAEPEAAIAADQVRAHIRAAVAELPAALRECLLLTPRTASLR